MHGILSQGRVYSRRKESGLSGLPVCHLRAFRETLEGVGTLRRRISRKLSAADGKDGESSWEMRGCRAGNMFRIATWKKSIGGSGMRGIRGGDLTHCQRYSND